MIIHLRKPCALFAAAFVAAAVWMSSAAPTASAQEVRRCSWIAGDHTACIYQPVSHVGVPDFDVSMLLDVEMPGAYAASIVNFCGPSTFKAELWGDDGGGSEDDFLRTVPSIIKPGTFFAGFDFLHSEYFFNPVPASVLDEDRLSDLDEIYGRISFRDCHTGDTRRFRTGTIKGDFFF